MNLVIEGTFDEILQIVYDSYYHDLRPASITLISKELFGSDNQVTVKPEHASKVQKAIEAKFTDSAKLHILKAFLNAQVDFLALYRYIMLGFKNIEALKDINQDCVQKIEKFSKETSSESHKVKGYLRFKELEDGELFAIIAPKHNVLPLIGGFFKKRLPCETFIIYDEKRKLALFDDMCIREIVDIEVPRVSSEEELFQKAWSGFFRSITVKERENQKLQRQKVPLYLRKHMSEFQ